MRRKYKSGQVFGRLTILEILYGHRNPRVRCSCSCGNEYWGELRNITNGIVVSCGCNKAEKVQLLQKKLLLHDNTHPFSIVSNVVRSDSSTKIKGVLYNPNKRNGKVWTSWVAVMTHQGIKHQKRFTSKDAAIAQRKEWEDLYFEPLISHFKGIGVLK